MQVGGCQFFFSSNRCRPSALGCRLRDDAAATGGSWGTAKEGGVRCEVCGEKKSVWHGVWQHRGWEGGLAGRVELSCGSETLWVGISPIRNG
jgi:hypothetical protein